MKKTQSTTANQKTEKIMFNGREVFLNFNQEKLVSVTADGTTTNICASKYETLYEAQNVKIKIPGHNMNGKIIIDKKQFSIEENCLIEALIPSYFRSGVFVKNGDNSKLITRNFFDPSKNPYNLPFGKTTIGSIEIQKCITHTGEEKIIINFYTGPIYEHKVHGNWKLKEIKFLSEISEKKDYALNLFPGEELTTYIVVK